MGLRAESLAGRGVVYARSGRPEDARQMLAALDDLATKQHVSPFYHAVVYIALGQNDQALELLARAADERTWLMRLLKVDPAFDPLRSDPRFQALVERVGLRG